MEQFLIVCPLVFLAGFVDSIAGGGGLISFPAYMLAGVPGNFKAERLSGIHRCSLKICQERLYPF